MTKVWVLYTVWVLYADEFEDRWVLGVFSSQEKAKEAWAKWYSEKKNPRDLTEEWWVTDDEDVIIEYELDEVKV